MNKVFVLSLIKYNYVCFCQAESSPLQKGL